MCPRVVAGSDDALQDLDARQSGRLGTTKTASGTGTLRGLDASRHFSYHGLEGGTGEERWHHVATDFHKDLPELAQGLRPQNDYR